MQRLRAKAADAANSVHHEIKVVPELRELLHKVSHFALSEIRQQVHQAKMQEIDDVIRDWKDGDGQCNCHAYRRYRLSCLHIVSTDETAIPLNNIPSFWRLNN